MYDKRMTIQIMRLQLDRPLPFIIYLDNMLHYATLSPRSKSNVATCGFFAIHSYS